VNEGDVDADVRLPLPIGMRTTRSIR
jgi:hypothetical protein